MDPERQRIQDDLRGLVAGDVRCDDVLLPLFGSDASIFQVQPLAVVRPRTTADVSKVVGYAAEKKLPVHARGAGTGLAGESLGRGIVVDFSRYMRRILRTDEDTVRVQPGVVLGLLNESLRGRGRVFGPDPANSPVTTMGSVIALDASGSYWRKYGSARCHVVGLQVVLADGTIMEVSREALPLDRLGLLNGESAGSNGNTDHVTEGSTNGTESAPENTLELRRSELAQNLANIIAPNKELIRQYSPKSLVNRCGYQLNDVLGEGEIDLARLLCGSEGTLALITEATVSTQTLPRYRGIALLFFDRLECAAQAVQEILPLEPCACDLLDRRHLSLARETNREYEALIPAEAEAILVVEFFSDDAAEVREGVAATIDRIRRKKQLAFDARQAFDSHDVELFWQLPRRVVETLHRLKGRVRPIPIVEDVAVPPSALPDFLLTLQNTLKRHQVMASLHAHAGHGQLHIRPFMDLSLPDDVRKMHALAEDLYGEVLTIGGTISGEHGTGLSRAPYVRRQYGPLLEVFQQIKQAFDPAGIFNPGRVIVEESAPAEANVRSLSALTTLASTEIADPVPAPSEVNGNIAATNGSATRLAIATQAVSLQLNWQVGQYADETRRCNGCGACRSQLPDMRMCPIFRVLPAEEASPRAKANLLRAVLDGALPTSSMVTDEFKSIADLCVNCHQCRLECPASVDIPKLMIEAKASYVQANGLRPGDWLLARFDLLSKWGSKIATVSNWSIQNRAARWLLEKTLGIAQGRKLPRFANRSFLRRATRRRLTRPTRRSGRKILYFVDTYANYHDPQLAEALVAVMEHNGVAVYVHPNQKPSGLGLITMGSIPSARRLASYNLHLLAEAVRQGYHIVATEPSTVICLTHEYLHLIDDADARAVAENTSEACGYLWQLHQRGKLQLDFKPLPATVGYHQPCHMRAISLGSPGENLLRLIPGLNIQTVQRGCSGMAGLWGLKRENYRTSLRAGWGLISRLRDADLQAGTTECSACKMQMEQGSTKPTLHPLKLLALSYGLMPDVASLLMQRSEELVVT